MKKFIVAAALSLVASGVGSAVAAQTTIYPASLCKAWSGTFQLNWDTAENATSAFTRVDCPVEKHGSNIASGYFRVKDLNATSGVECTLESVYVSGTNIFFWDSGTLSSGGSSGTWTQLSFGALPADPAGYYYYSCSIPPVGVGVSAIANYSVTEN